MLLPNSNSNDASTPSQNTKNPESRSYWISVESFRNYLILQRRALLQSVSSDEKLLKDLDSLTKQLHQGNELNAIVSLLVAFRKNTDERRKAFLQIVRDIERRYSMGNDKKRYRNRR